MPKIEIVGKNRPAIEVNAGSNLMRSLLDAGLPVASSCNGDGVCAKCRLRIMQGAENLSSPNETEQFLAQKFELKPDTRISCQTTVLGDISVSATYW